MRGRPTPRIGAYTGKIIVDVYRFVNTYVHLDPSNYKYVCAECYMYMYDTDLVGCRTCHMQMCTTCYLEDYPRTCTDCKYEAHY